MNRRRFETQCRLAMILFSGTTLAVAGPPSSGHSSAAPMHMSAPAPAPRSAPSARTAAAPRYYNGNNNSGYINWHAAWNTGIRGAASRYPARPIHPVYGNGWRTDGYGWRGGTGAVLIPFYAGVPYDTSAYYDTAADGSAVDNSGESPYPPVDDSGAAPYDPNAAPYDPNAPYAAAPPPYAMQPAAGYPQQPTTSASAPSQAQPPITVVLLNGQHVVVQNYAIVDSTLWDFSTSAPHRIALSSIDLNASIQATNATGAEFPQLTPSSDDAR